MKKRLKVLFVFIAVLSLSFSFSNNSFAAEKYTQSSGTITPYGAICPNCYEGTLISNTTQLGPYLDSSYVCPSRIDCLVKVYRYDYVMQTRCSICGFGYTSYPAPTYYTVHTKSH